MTQSSTISNIRECDLDLIGADFWLYANVTAAVVGGCCRPSCSYHNILTYCFITHTSSFCKSIKNPLKGIFCAAVFWWLIWLRNHTSLPQQTHRGAQMNRSRPPNLPVVEKECATSFLLNSFISVTSWVFPFAELNGEKKEKKSVKKYISEQRRSLLKSLFPEWSGRGAAGFMFLFSVLRQTHWTLLVQTTTWVELLTRRMSRSVRLNDRRAAYHVPHR